MKTALAGVAATSMLLAVAGAAPASAMPIQRLGLSGANAALDNVDQVQYRRYYPGHYRYWGPRYRYGYRHRYWGPRYGYWGPRYRYWGGYPYYGYRYYRPGPWVGIGPFGFGFGW